jgi:hypothetical protein
MLVHATVTNPLILAVAGVALAAGAAAAAMVGLTGAGSSLEHRFAAPLFRCNTEDHGIWGGDGGVLLCQIRVHLSEPRKKAGHKMNVK